MTCYLRIVVIFGFVITQFRDERTTTRDFLCHRSFLFFPFGYNAIQYKEKDDNNNVLLTHHCFWLLQHSSIAKRKTTWNFLCCFFFCSSIQCEEHDDNDGVLFVHHHCFWFCYYTIPRWRGWRREIFHIVIFLWLQLQLVGKRKWWQHIACTSPLFLVLL